MKLEYNLIRNICAKYGDSVYILDSNLFNQNYNELLTAFKSFYSKTQIGYSYKTNYIPKLCSIINKNGGLAEVVSEMEYDLAIKVGVLPENIIVNGPYKTLNKLEKYLLNGSLVNIDSGYEINYLKLISNKYPDKKFRLGIRCNFQINSKYISRFGIDISSNDFYSFFETLNSIENISLEGIHCHFPDRNLDLYRTRIETMLSLSKKLFSTPPKFIDIGGGYFGKMDDFLAKQFNISIPSYMEYAELIGTIFNEAFRDINNQDKPTLIIEPGSAIVANTMYFIVKVIDIKNIQNKKNIVVTSGSKFNLGSFSSTINMPMKIYSQNNEQNPKYYDIAGYTCIESDYLFTNYFGSISPGDFLSFSNVGSYSIVFKPPFIMPNFAIIDLDEHQNISLIKRCETMEDLFTTYTF